jgi:hypothetical protein
MHCVYRTVLFVMYFVVLYACNVLCCTVCTYCLLCTVLYLVVYNNVIYLQLHMYCMYCTVGVPFPVALERAKGLFRRLPLQVHRDLVVRVHQPKQGKA